MRRLILKRNEPLATGLTTSVAVPVARGSVGAGVRWVQTALRLVGFDPGPVDGAFGAGTERAVRAFQAAARMAVDGVVGEGTVAALLAVPGRPVVSARPYRLADPDQRLAA
jgi:peptidoglycan hydrolase-like protein with peptidoglycan-binding domain